MMVDMAQSVRVNDVKGLRRRLDIVSSWENNIGRVLTEFTNEELKAFSWGAALKIVVGFLDILFVSNFAQYEILPIPDKYTNQGVERGNQIQNSFEEFLKTGFAENEMLFRRMLANIFIQYTRCALIERMHEMNYCMRWLLHVS